MTRMFFPGGQGEGQAHCPSPLALEVDEANRRPTAASI